MISNATAGTLGDKETLNDFISSQKFTMNNYNLWASECVCEGLRNDLLTMLKEEHNIQNELFHEASTRGWYPVKQAPQNEIDQVYQKFNA